MKINRKSLDTDPSVPLSKLEQEKFAQARAEGHTLREASKIAGYTSKSPNAGHKLANEKHVRARIEFLMQADKILKQARTQARTQALKHGFSIDSVSVEFLVQEALENLSLARASGDIRTANQSVALMAQLIGIDLEKKTNKDPNKGKLPTNASEDRLGKQINVQILNQITDRMGRPSGDQPQAEKGDPAAGEGRSLAALSDDRSERSISSFKSLVVDDAVAVPLVAPVPRE